MEYNPSGSSLHGMLQVIILERITISSSRGSSLGRDWASIFCIGRLVLYHWATREVLTQKLTLCFLHALLYCLLTLLLDRPTLISQNPHCLHLESSGITDSCTEKFLYLHVSDKAIEKQFHLENGNSQKWSSPTDIWLGPRVYIQGKIGTSQVIKGILN